MREFPKSRRSDGAILTSPIRSSFAWGAIPAPEGKSTEKRATGFYGPP